MEFTWDQQKNRANQRKHRISFEVAILAFDDPSHISLQDRKVDGEVRWQTIGMVNGTHVLTVDESIPAARIISARKATPQERNIYAQDF